MLKKPSQVGLPLQVEFIQVEFTFTKFEKVTLFFKYKSKPTCDGKFNIIYSSCAGYFWIFDCLLTSPSVQ